MSMGRNRLYGRLCDGNLKEAIVGIATVVALSESRPGWHRAQRPLFDVRDYSSHRELVAGPISSFSILTRASLLLYSHQSRIQADLNNIQLSGNLYRVFARIMTAIRPRTLQIYAYDATPKQPP
jgi:hypothetical protein